MDKENASGVLRTEVHRHSKGPGSSYFRIPLGADSSMDSKLSFLINICNHAFLSLIG